eukprot:m.1614 g.1614  ORF g.1614 m.1614 type:complete len:53 (+) comp832_c0_seq1:62-220(+)
MISNDRIIIYTPKLQPWEFHNYINHKYTSGPHKKGIQRNQINPRNSAVRVTQ